MEYSEHFTRDELKCKCGCNICNMEDDFMNMLEKLRNTIGKPIIITSGFRCPSHSVNVGGYSNDAHTKGFACDIMVNGLSSYDIAEYAEKCGFTGIGIISDTACHIDNRNTSKYNNGHWFGNEMTGDNNIKSFIRTSSTPTTSTSTTMSINGITYKITMEVIK